MSLLPHTDAAGGSPLSYGQRLDIGRPIRDGFRKARFATVPVFTDEELQRRVLLLAEMSDVLCSPSLDFQDLYAASNEVVKYGHHVADCRAAHINGRELPAEPALVLPELRSAGAWPAMTSSVQRGRPWRRPIPPDQA